MQDPDVIHFVRVLARHVVGVHGKLRWFSYGAWCVASPLAISIGWGVWAAQDLPVSSRGHTHKYV